MLLGLGLLGGRPAQGNDEEAVALRMSPSLSRQAEGERVLVAQGLGDRIVFAQATDTRADVPESTPESAGRGFVLPPIRWWGNTSYDIRSESQSEGNRVNSQFQTTQLNAESFIWQPWFARVSANGGYTTNTVQAESSQKSNFVTGGARVTVFPVSRFPFEAFYEKSDSRTGGDVVGTGFASSRLGLTQRYAAPEGRLTMLGSYDHTAAQPEGGVEDTFDALQFDISQSFKEHNLTGNARYTTNQRGDGASQTDFFSLVGQHSWRPSAALSVENLASFNRTDSQFTAGQSVVDFLQASSTAFWRPEDERWLVNGGLRYFSLASDIGGGATTANSINGNAGFNFQWTRAVRFSGSGSFSQVQTGSTSSLSTSQNASANYSPDSFEIGAFRYNWFAGASFSNRTSPTESGQQYSAQIGHGLDRSFTLGEQSILSFSLSQSTAAVVDSVADPVQTIAHSAGVGWNLGQGAVQTSVRLSASDNRNLTGPETSFQVINLTATRNQQLGARSVLTGDMNFQWTRQTLAAEAGASQTNVSANGNVIYQHFRLFDIPRLRFTSEYRVSTAQFNTENTGELTQLPRNLETMSWENRLEYLIGRTDLRLSFRLSEVNGRQVDLLLLRINRQFGDL